MREIEKLFAIEKHGQARFTLSGYAPGSQWTCGEVKVRGGAWDGLTADDLRQVVDELDRLNRKARIHEDFLMQVNEEQAKGGKNE